MRSLGLAFCVTVAVLLVATSTAWAQIADTNHGPYRWPRDVKDKFDKRGQEVNGWDYFLNDTSQNQHFIPLQYDELLDAWLDPLFGLYFDGIFRGDNKFELIPDGAMNVKLALHPNVNDDLVKKGPNWFLKVNAKARPGGCSLSIFIAPSGADGLPDPAALGLGGPAGGGIIPLVPRKVFGPNEPINELIPIRIGPDGQLQHCNWIIIEIDDPDGGGGDPDPDEGLCFGFPPEWPEGHVIPAPSDGLPPFDKFEFYPAECPLISELVVTPTGSKFIEIWNPTDHTVDLITAFLSNSPLYYGTPTQDGTVDTLSGGGGFWNARFPPGFFLLPDERAVVSVDGATSFLAAYGALPDFELISTDPAVPDMLPAFPGSIGPAPDLHSAGLVMLYGWMEPEDLICDCDYVHWGGGGKVDKTGIAVDGIDADAIPGTYLADTPVGDQVPLEVASSPHKPGESWHRREVRPLEGLEKQGGPYNGCFPVPGITSHDETSENVIDTFMVICGPTPGFPPGLEGPCPDEGLALEVDPSDPPPAIPLDGIPKPCVKLTLLFSTDPAFGGKPVKMKVKNPAAGTFTPKAKTWLKMLKKLSALGSTIYVRALCKKEKTEADLGTIKILPPTAPAPTAPADKVSLPGDPPPTFDGDLNSGVKCWLEFSTARGFATVTKKSRVKEMPAKASKGAWKKLRKKLEKAGAGGTAYWRIRCLDALGRETISPVREFMYTAP